MPRKEKYPVNSDGFKRHQITYKDAQGNTVKKRLCARTDAEMDAKINDFNRSIGNGSVLFTSSVTFADYSSYWLSSSKSGSVSANTLKSYTSLLSRLTHDLGALPLCAITSLDLQRTLNAVSAMSSSYITKYRNLIIAIFESAVRDNYLSRSPAIGLTIPRGTRGTHRALSDTERAQVTALCEDHPLGLVVLLMLYAGLRRGEAAYIDIDRDVDFDAMTLTVRGALWFDGNKGVSGSTKSAAGMRTIPIFPPLQRAILSARGQGNAFHPIRGGDITQIAFKRSWESFISKLSDTQNGFTRRWPKRDESGNPLPYIPSDIRCHDLRHTFATMLFDANVDVKTAQYWLGHADVSTTLRIYTHLTNAKKYTATAAAEQYFTRMCKIV